MLKKLLKAFTSLIFPDTCLICNKIISGSKFCFTDWNNLHFLGKPACKICFHPFEFKTDDEMICGKCLQQKPQYNKAISVLNYDDHSRILISKFKYFDQTELSKYFAELMFKAAKEIWFDIDFIAPVPLHKLRIIKRKYNQAAFLAKNISAFANKKLLLDLLVRTRNNKPQATLNQKMRRKNVKGIFAVKEKYLTTIAGKNILLIDDVITTGSTVEDCAKTLKKAKANKIYVLTLAKTII